MKKYAICRHGNKITVKLTDRNHDFGEVINERDTLPEARLCARVERMVLKRHLSNATPSDGRSGDRSERRIVDAKAAQ